MTPARAGIAAVAAGVLAASALIGWVVFIQSGRTRSATAPVAAPAATTAAPEGRKIKVHLFYVSDTGAKLKTLDQEVPYGEGAVDQAKAIVTAQIAPPQEPNVTAIPAGTTLRALFITPKGEAYVDLSPEFRTAHPGGSTNELLTIYTLVNALTANLPAVTAVQLLVDGKEIDTLSGHVDLRRPLMKNLAWVE